MAGYALSDMTRDLGAAMTSRPIGPLSGRALGNSANKNLWSPADVADLYEGLETARNSLYPEFTAPEFARVAICVAMQESTGDFTLHVAEGGASQGLMQVSPASVLADFAEYGAPLPPIIPHQTTTADVSSPGQSVALWAWYTRAAAVTGVSVAEYVHRDAWDIVTRADTATLGDGLLAWLEGPSARRYAGDARVDAHIADYRARIADYWTGAGFGSAADLSALLDDRPLAAGTLRYVVASDRGRRRRRRSARGGDHRN